MKANENEITTNSHLHLVQREEQPPTAGYPEHEGHGWELLLASMLERDSQPAAKFPTSSSTTVSRAA